MPVATDVANAAKTALEALALTGATVVRRKTPSVPEGVTISEDAAQVVVSLGEVETEYLTATLSMLIYPLTVTVVTGGGSKLADSDTLHDWRQQIRRKMEERATWSTVSGWDHVEAGGMVPFDLTALRQDFNYSPLPFRVFVVEPRT